MTRSACAQLPSPRLFVFDWDGTLIDSIGHIVACLRGASTDLGFADLGDVRYSEVIGLGLPQAIAALYPDANADLAERYRARYVEHFLASTHEASSLFPGALRVLHELRARGHLLAVATGKSRRGLDRVLRAMEMAHLFDATRCADETASKPDPAMLREIFVELGVAPHEAVVVGDTEFDLEMARRAGAHPVGVSYGSHASARLRRHEPVMIIDMLEQLLSFTLQEPARPARAEMRSAG